MALVFKDLLLDLSSVADDRKEAVKKEVADLLYNEVLRYVGKGKSPVSGEASNFKILNKQYAKREKQGRRNPNLQLEGDLMREDFNTQVSAGDSVKVGHFKESTAKSQGEKADGHNQHTAKAQAWAAKKPFPRRRYIPSDAQTFRKDILDKVDRLIGKYKEDDPLDLAAGALNDILRESGRPSTVRETTDTTSVGIDDFLDDEFLAELIGDRLNI